MCDTDFIKSKRVLFMYTKEQIENMSKEEIYDFKQECYDSDYYEFLDHFRGQRSIDIAWEEFDMETEMLVTPEMVCFMKSAL